MTQTEHPTLQSVLREKYNITDPLFAEGRFVALIGDHAVNLVCLGLSMKCLMVAKIAFSGDNMDYDLISITPLPLLSMSYECSSKKIKIKSQFKAIQVFQLCSTVNEAGVWDDFTSIICDVHQQLRGGDWISTTVRAVSKPYKMSFNEVNAYTNVFIHPRYPRNNESSISLPTRLLSQETEWRHDTCPRYHSADVLNVEFDRFVNDVHTTLVNENEINMPNKDIRALSNIPVNEDIEKESGSKFTKFFRRFLPCCKAKK